MIAVEEFDNARRPRAADEDSLSDDDLRSEIELVADLVVAVSTSDGPLSQPDIDRILGLGPA